MMDFTDLSFRKMHGAGNDFVILDAREQPLQLPDPLIRAISDRNRGVGCDQLIVLEPAKNAECYMRIYNADGSMSATCGNATRCVASILFDEHPEKTIVTINTLAGQLTAKREPMQGMFQVDMGSPQEDWQSIPLSEPRDTLHLGIEEGVLKDPVAVSMGNPHAVFFVNDVESVPLSILGPRLEHHPLFPKRANINVAEILSGERIRLRVWERGAGETLACGSGACATVVAAIRRGLLTGKQAMVMLNGGTLHIAVAGNGHVLMTGEAVTCFTGVFSPDFISRYVA